MMRRFTAVVLVIYFMLTLPAFAGTWSDGFEHPDLDEWELHHQAGNQATWEIENGLLLGDQSGTSGMGIGDDTWENYTVEATVILLEERLPGPNTPRLTWGRRMHVLEASSMSRLFFWNIQTVMGWKASRSSRWSYRRMGSSDSLGIQTSNKGGIRPRIQAQND